MKKQMISAALAAAMCASLAACGGSSSTSTATTAADKAAATTAAAAQSSEAKAGESSGASSDIPADAKVLKWSEVNGDDYGATVGARAFAKKLLEVSNGKLAIDIYTNATLGDEKTSMQGIQMGTLDCFRGNASSLPNYGASKIGLTGLPYIFQGIDQAEAMSKSDIGQQLLDSVAEEDPGYVAIGWMVEGPRSLFITDTAYKNAGSPTEFSLDKIKGMKIRVPETDLMVNTMKGLGASATPISYSELYTSLQSGVVDGAENNVVSYLANSFNEVAPYFIDDGHTFGLGVDLVSKQTWDSLSEEEQGWMKEAAKAGADACYEFNKAQEQKAYDSFKDKGVTQLKVPDLDKWSEACSSIYASYSAEDQETIKALQAVK
ncbi:TRAP transporter substrate-binding protein [Clostridium vitabionis]|uniref:TRAP transporter substrate-binding protein n=1 Tax=Clostridium vitabionis TaxID=2784388 RepID=UPI001F264C6E|nr:TRAP transporter substrate-binding protein [Clostridium vitabionis]